MNIFKQFDKFMEEQNTFVTGLTMYSCIFVVCAIIFVIVVISPWLLAIAPFAWIGYMIRKFNNWKKSNAPNIE